MADQWEMQLHDRLITGDKTASAELAETLLDDLVAGLRRRFPTVDDIDLHTTAAIDAVMAYIKDPGKFDSSKRSLKGYLRMAAEGDFLNSLESQSRRCEHESAQESVEEVASRRNKNREARPESNLIAKEDEGQFQRLLSELFDTEIDRKLADLVLSQVRETEEYSQILGIEDEPIDEQRTIVKRHKDRIKKRLKEANRGKQ